MFPGISRSVCSDPMNNTKTHTMYQKKNPFAYPTNGNSNDLAYDFPGNTSAVFSDSSHFQVRGTNGTYEQFEDPEMVSNNVPEADSNKDLSEFFDSFEKTVDSSSNAPPSTGYSNYEYVFPDNVDEIHGIQDFQKVDTIITEVSPQCANPQLLMLTPAVNGKRRHEDEHSDLEDNGFYSNSFVGFTSSSSNNWNFNHNNAPELTEYKRSIDSDKTLVAIDDAHLDLDKMKASLKLPSYDVSQSGDVLPECQTPDHSHSSHDSTSFSTTKPTFQDVDFWNRHIADGGDIQNTESYHENETTAFNGGMNGSRFEDLSEDYSSRPMYQKIHKTPTISMRSSQNSLEYRNGSSSVSHDGSRSGSTSPNRRKKQRINPKQIPPHFIVLPGFKITLQNSHVKCLDVNLDYHGYEGKITQVILNNDITNYHHDSSYDPDFLPPERRVSLHMPYQFRRGEILEGDPWCSKPDGLKVEIHCHMGLVERKVHIRDISDIMGLVTRITYLHNTEFDINRPYEPQYTRYETDEYGKFINETKCGLCAFCKEVKFLPFKNSSYLSHMTLEHGVFSDHFIVPEGINFGKYIVSKGDEKEPEKTKEIEALQCPDCFEIVEMNCWSTKKNPLLKYFRHYKKEHSKKQNNVLSKVNPLEYRGRDLR